MIQFEMPTKANSIITVIGIGGGGSNAVNYMYLQSVPYINYMVCNTDMQDLDKSPVSTKVALGPKETEGLGAGADPKIGEKATIESKEELKKILQQNVKMVFLTAGMGGGTGTGGTPIIAQICKDLNILTVAIVTMPFEKEGRQRTQNAQEGVEKLKENVDVIIKISNDKIREKYGNLSRSQAFAKANDVVANAIQSITNIIYTTGQVNVDFADVCRVMRKGGMAIMGVAKASGADRATEAVQEALASPLLNDVDISGAKYALVNISTPKGDNEIKLDEEDAILNQIRNAAGDEVEIFLGTYETDSDSNEIGLTLIVTGFHILENDNKKNVVKEITTPTEKIEYNHTDHFNNRHILNDNLINESKSNKEVVIDFSSDKSENRFNHVSNKPISFNDEKNFLAHSKPASSLSNFQHATKNLNDNADKVDKPKHTVSINDLFARKTNTLNDLPFQESLASKEETREKKFREYSFMVDSNVQKKIFVEKEKENINFNLNPSMVNNISELGNLSITKDKNEEVSIKKVNEYSQFHLEKRPD